MNHVFIQMFSKIVWMLFCLSSTFALGSEDLVYHDFTVTLFPNEHKITCIDKISFPPSYSVKENVYFLLHAGLNARSIDDKFIVEKVNVDQFKEELDVDQFSGFDAEVPLDAYVMRLAGGGLFGKELSISIEYQGAIYHAITSENEEYDRSFSQTPGLISDDGTFLSSSSFWYPLFDSNLLSFRLGVDLPLNREAISQGRRIEHEVREGRRWIVWDCPHPMDDIYLIDAPFKEYSVKTNPVTTYAYLRTPDPALANQYLEATSQFIKMYNDLIGPYPFSKFALIENFWETGYGMPSFTLLGSKVIRFPFILYSSYPHEILHNWWGNSVFVDYGSGNWCEGLTAYLADHLLKEIKGEGDEYRRNTLQKYLNYVKEAKDFPLCEFTSRHNAATEAVGYGKSLMLFHMLRIELGDDFFKKSLAEFYNDFIFKRASFNDLSDIFSRVSGKDLKPFFKQWVNRKGAPIIRLKNYIVGKTLNVTLIQEQEEDPFIVNIPLAIYYNDVEEASIKYFEMRDREIVIELDDPERISRVDIDPYFDIFRYLDRGEIPSTIGQAFGADKVLIVLPHDEAEQWKDMVSSWSTGKNNDELIVCNDNDINSIPTDRSIWILGQHNSWRKKVTDDLIFYKNDAFSIQDKHISSKNNSIVLTMIHPSNPDMVLLWVSADNPDCIQGLGRKLPHYGKYSYLAFEGTEPTNILKGQWPRTQSSMILTLKNRCNSVLPKRKPLTELPSLVNVNRLKNHVYFLSDDRLEGRGLGTPELDEAAQYIAQVFKQSKLLPNGDNNTFFQSWDELLKSTNKTYKLTNVIGYIPCINSSLINEPVVFGAHYDHLGLGWPDVRKGNEGKVHNGADDNCSGISVMLELATLLGDTFTPDRPVIFIAFTGEESDLLGSQYFINNLKIQNPECHVYAMINLDSVGRLNNRNLIVFGGGSTKEWPYIIQGASYVTGLASEIVPNDPGTGDQNSFLNNKIPAVHLFSGIHEDYHSPEDDAYKIDFSGLEKITEFSKEILVYLATRKEPLNVLIDGTNKESNTITDKTISKKRSSLGTIPDFTFQGSGVKIASVVDDSPAQSAGLMKGDIITAINDFNVYDLKGLSEALKKWKPGDLVTIHLLRNNVKMIFSATLQER